MNQSDMNLDSYKMVVFAQIGVWVRWQEIVIAQ